MKPGIVVMYNGVDYIITEVERENMKIIGIWCDDCCGDVAFLHPSQVEVV